MYLLHFCRSKTSKKLQLIPIPSHIDSAHIIEYTHLTSANTPTGSVRHTTGGVELKTFHGLAIGKYDDESGVYLFYCDADWNALTDTWHADLLSARAQAAFEFNVAEEQWIRK